jgi:hypothetical protein
MHLELKVNNMETMSGFVWPELLGPPDVIWTCSLHLDDVAEPTEDDYVWSFDNLTASKYCEAATDGPDGKGLHDPVPCGQYKDSTGEHQRFVAYINSDDGMPSFCPNWTRYYIETCNTDDDSFHVVRVLFVSKDEHRRLMGGNIMCPNWPHGFDGHWPRGK